MHSEVAAREMHITPLEFGVLSDAINGAAAIGKPSRYPQLEVHPQAAMLLSLFVHMFE